MHLLQLHIFIIIMNVFLNIEYCSVFRKYTEIARGNPQWPQAFYSIKSPVTVKKGQYLHARCTYNTTGVERYTSIGEDRHRTKQYHIFILLLLLRNY